MTQAKNKITNYPTPRHPDPVVPIHRPGNQRRKIKPRGCSVDSCANRHHALGLCRTHLSRLQQDRPVDVVPVRHYRIPDCAVTDCDRPHYGGGYCVGHGRRLRRHGDVRAEVPLRRRTGPLSYSAAHARVKAIRGMPTGHACVDCASRAVIWSYDYTDPNQLVGGPRRTPYSVEVRFYQPRCVSCCHRIGYRNRLVRGVSC